MAIKGRKQTKQGFRKGHKPWNKGIPHTEETKRKVSEAKKGTKASEETKRKISEANKGNKHPFFGKHHTKESRKIISENLKSKTNVKGRFQKGREAKPTKTSFKKGMVPWNKGRGNKTSENERARDSIEFRLWREAVFARDNFTCQKCDERGGKLHPHHIKNFAQFPELRFAIDNGITFCEKCHRKFHSIYGLKNNTEEQINEYINE